MGSSNMGIGTTGDIEDQQHNPKWFVDYMHMSHPSQEEEPNKLGFVILKVPEYWRQPPEAFCRKRWLFGLHNRENWDNSGSEAFKLAIAMQYGLVGEKWIHFCNAIIDDPKAILACYGLRNEVTSWSDEQIKYVLALDALFLATYIDRVFPMEERRLWTPRVLPSLSDANDVFHIRDKPYSNWAQVGVGTMIGDLHHVENQIPLILIDKVVDYISTFVASPTSEGNEPFIGDLQYQQRGVDILAYLVSRFFMNTLSEAFKIDDTNSSSGKTHILGAAYKVICGSKGLLMTRTNNEYICIPSATKLKQSGIKLIAIDGPLYTMSYNKKCLYLPMMKIYDDTSSFVQNMAWYEMNTTTNGCLFHDYIFLMTDLIQAPEDLHLLVKHNVIYNACGMKGFEMWTTLQEGLIEIPSSQTHHEMKKDIMSRCRLRKYRLWSEFKIVFCSKPWLVLSTIAIVLVTVATLVQTYIAIIGSNKMKPKFP